jgi:hypothetical protein
MQADGSIVTADPNRVRLRHAVTGEVIERDHLNAAEICRADSAWQPIPTETNDAES